MTHGKYLAVVWAFTLQRAYFNGKKLTEYMELYMDKLTLNLADATGSLVRWKFGLSLFELEVVHEDYVHNQAPDTLARLKTADSESILPRDHIEKFMVLLVEHTRWATQKAHAENFNFYILSYLCDNKAKIVTCATRNCFPWAVQISIHMEPEGILISENFPHAHASNRK